MNMASEVTQKEGRVQKARWRHFGRTSCSPHRTRSAAQGAFAGAAEPNRVCEWAGKGRDFLPSFSRPNPQKHTFGGRLPAAGTSSAAARFGRRRRTPPFRTSPLMLHSRTPVLLALSLLILLFLLVLLGLLLYKVLQLRKRKK